jgi:acyl dehydratase
VTAALTDFSAGHVFQPVTFRVDSDRVRAYRNAVGDTLPLYDAHGVAPPLALAAFALGVLLESVRLPDGSLHVNESVRFLAPVPAGAEVECRAKLVQRSVRAGMVVSVIESEVLYRGAAALTARATVMSPGGAS